MGSNLVDLPMKLLMPSSFDNTKEIAFKTIPSVSKVEIKRVLESMYGFEVEKVRTLNMQGKKKRKGGRMVARPNYKKAYVTLKNPLSFASEIYPKLAMEEERGSKTKQLKPINFLEENLKSLWLGSDEPRIKPEKLSSQRSNNDSLPVKTFGR